MAKIQVLGTGCSKCRRLLKNAQASTLSHALVNLQICSGYCLGS
jgi:hypothetical protein